MVVVGYFGIILVCMSSLAEHCDIITSPHIFITEEECKADVLNESLRIKNKYSHANINPNCAALKHNGEPV
tara:strand:- start:294 stop:506 length:213 start_codon:yes stop_codon:yes gene_type:complete